MPIVRFFLAVSFLLLCLLPFHVYAEAVESPAITPPKEGLLWKIDKDELPSSYLFGTIHSEDKRVLDLPDVVQETFAQSTRLVLEMNMDDIDMLAVVEKLFLPDDENLAVMLGKEDFQRLFMALSRHGVMVNMAMRLKPWVAMMILSFPESEGGDYLDLYLEKQAKAKDVPVYGLETVDEQFNVFEKFSLDEQLVMLRGTLDEVEQMPQFLETMHTLYLARDLDGIQKLSEDLLHSEDPNEEALMQRLWKRLLDDRNHVMLARMQAHLAAGNAFVAVGALHLVDTQGLVVMLQQQGYTVSKLY